MWIAFDNEGNVICQINYGSRARQGITSSFSIFAVFTDETEEPISFVDGTDVATINFTRPDGTNIETTYFMDLTSSEYVPSNASPITNAPSVFFISGQDYPGFIFSPSDPAILSMAGQYKATIKVYRTNEMIFAGTIVFNVENAVYNKEYNISATQWEELMRYLPKVKYATQEVDTNEYPTLEDFLETEGQEGIIYLYPIDTTQPEEGYYQYLWLLNSVDPVNHWVNIGTTHLDHLLSDYTLKTETEADINEAVNNLPTERAASAWESAHRQLYFADSRSAYKSGSLLPWTDIRYNTVDLTLDTYGIVAYIRNFTFTAGKTYTIYLTIPGTSLVEYWQSFYLNESKFIDWSFQDSAGGRSTYFTATTASRDGFVIKKTITMLQDVSYDADVFAGFIKINGSEIPSSITSASIGKIVILEGEDPMATSAHLIYDPAFYYDADAQKLTVPHVTTSFSAPYAIDGTFDQHHVYNTNGNNHPTYIELNERASYQIYFKTYGTSGAYFALGLVDTTILLSSTGSSNKLFLGQYNTSAGTYTFWLTRYSSRNYNFWCTNTSISDNEDIGYIVVRPLE